VAVGSLPVDVRPYPPSASYPPSAQLEPPSCIEVTAVDFGWRWLMSGYFLEDASRCCGSEIGPSGSFNGTGWPVDGSGMSFWSCIAAAKFWLGLLLRTSVLPGLSPPKLILEILLSPPELFVLSHEVVDLPHESTVLLWTGL